MKLPAASEIPLEKLTHYLLVPKAKADKSKFLSRAGYSIEEAETLIDDIHSQILRWKQRQQARPNLVISFKFAPRCADQMAFSLRVKTIWIREHLRGNVRFVTLLPDKSKTT